MIPFSERSDKSTTVYRRLMTYTRPYTRIFILSMLATLVASGFDSGLAYLFKPLLDRGFIGKDHGFLTLFPFLVVGIFLIRAVMSFFSSYGLMWIARKVVMMLRQQIFQHLLKLPAAYFDTHSSGEILSKIIYNVEQVASASTQAVTVLVRESCYVMGLLVVMCVVSWQLTLFFMMSLPIIAVIVKISSRLMRGFSHRVQQRIADVSHIAEEVIEGYKVVRLFGGELYETRRFEQMTEANRHAEIQVVITESLSTSTVQLIAATVLTALVFFATRSANQSMISAGGFTSFIAAIIMLLKPLKNLTTVNSTIQKGVAGAESVFRLFDTPLEQDQGSLQLTRAKGHIVFNNLTFSYPGHEKPALYNISFEVKPGQTIALVGRSGSGKSTLASLLPRFYENYQGSITLDGIDIRAIKRADLRQQFAMVTQQTTLFNDTVRHNIAYGKQTEVEEALLQRALEMAHATDFVTALPQGLDTQVGENGVLLSGGERQRIAIARALIKDAPILILDEATSALDNVAEKYIQLALEALMQDRTCLVIAHRLSTIEKADLILVLDQGNIVERGTHRDLLAAQGTYASLYTARL